MRYQEPKAKTKDSPRSNSLCFINKHPPRIEQLTVIKGKKIGTPRVESEEYIMAIGSARPMEDAARIAQLEEERQKDPRWVKVPIETGESIWRKLKMLILLKVIF